MGKYLAAWLAMLLASVANGAIRDYSYGRYMAELSAHQLSTGTGIVLLGMIIRGFMRAYPAASGRQAIAIGLIWTGLTVAFEFVFFHYVGGHPWRVLLANYNIVEGRVWVLLLAWIAIAPYVFFRMRAAA